MRGPLSAQLIKALLQSCNTSFRATGITNFLENDGTLEAAQRIPGYADSRTTKLYERRGQKVLLEEMERIRY
jgi:integrase/recombinase XerD